MTLHAQRPAKISKPYRVLTQDSLVLHADVEGYTLDGSSAFTKHGGSSLQCRPLGLGEDEAS